ncbi:hypothetical protein [Chromobacterium sphagni]|nr:hypothetical protein [Chromobacterium sphagni]
MENPIQKRWIERIMSHAKMAKAIRERGLTITEIEECGSRLRKQQSWA